MPDEKTPDFWASFFLSISKIWVLIALPIMTAIAMIGQNMASLNPVRGWKMFGVIMFSCTAAWIVSTILWRTGYQQTAMIISPIITYTSHGLSLMAMRKLPSIISNIKTIKVWGVKVDFNKEEDEKTIR